VSVTDKQTRETIKIVYKKYKVILEQHGAVGWAGLVEYFKNIQKKNWLFVWKPRIRQNSRKKFKNCWD